MLPSQTGQGWQGAALLSHLFPSSTGLKIFKAFCFTFGQFPQSFQGSFLRLREPMVPGITSAKRSTAAA